MLHLFRFILLLIALELLGAGVVVVRHLLQPQPPLPTVEMVDPIVMNELHTLAQHAASGSDVEWQELGNALMGQGFYSHAEICFRRAAELNPQNKTAWHSVAFCLARTGRTKESTLIFEEVISMAAVNLKQDSLYAIGRNYLREENPELAEKGFLKNIDFFPAKYQYAKLLVRSGRTAEALWLIDKVLIKLPNTIRFQHLKYQASNLTGDTIQSQRAADMMERSLRLIPTNLSTNFIEPHSLSYGLSKELKEFNQMVESNNLHQLSEKLKEMLSLIKDNHLPHYKILLTQGVELEYKQKNPQRMFFFLDKLYQFGEQNAHLIELAGDASALSGEMKQAVTVWQRALQMDETVKLHQKLADYYQQQKNSSQRDFHLAKIAFMEGKNLFRKNRLPAANLAIQKAIKLDSGDPHMWFYNAEINRQLEYPRLAKAAYEQCLKLNPYHGRAITQLHQLKKTIK